MRQLFPPIPGGAVDVDPVAAYLPAAFASPQDVTSATTGLDRPWTTVNMVASMDGAVTVDGRSAGLSDPGDREIFRILRAMADVVVVGAGTARTERYGPARIAPHLAGGRVERGQAPAPPIAMVSTSGRIDDDLPVVDPEVADGAPLPMVITCEAGARQASKLGERAEIIVAGGDRVDLVAAFSALGQRGMRVAVSEGGPMLNAAMVRLGLLDEVCLTVASLAVGGNAGRIIADDPQLETPVPMELAHVLEHEGTLYTRWRFAYDTSGTRADAASAD